MFRFKKISSIVIVLAIVSVLISCDDDTSDDVDIQVVGDAFVLKRMIDNKTQYGHVYYLFANYPLSSASVVTPNGDNIPLAASDALSLVFSKEPMGEDYSENTPVNGLFDFSAKHIEENYYDTDNLDFIDMDIPAITSTEYIGSSETLKVNWNTVPEADSYIVRLVNNDNDIFFTGYLLDEEATSYEINQNTGTWLDHPSFNQRFVVELHASRYEQNKDELELYHVEEISIGEEIIFWGEE